MVNKKTKVGVFVYGDIGRSPRMQNHAEQLSKLYDVYLMGYFDTQPRSAIQENEKITQVDLQIYWLGRLKTISFYLYALVRILVQILQIIYLLGFKYRNLEFVLIQNPPSIPNLFGIWITSFIGFYKIYIDFHNYGYTILELKVKNRFIIKMAALYEKFFGKKCQRAFCVSDAMKQDLKKNWGIESETLYDRPRRNFVGKYDPEQFFNKYNLQMPKNDQILLVSSTSWTKDEDFNILLQAIQNYEESSCRNKLRAFITGKGPEKEFYVQKINQMKNSWKKVQINTVWLDADDYPTLLSVCHIGVCLHYSSSGLDLPMKIIDMFGAGIPVLAINYNCLSELVKDGRNGYIFKDSDDLFRKIVEVVQRPLTLKSLKIGAEKEQKYTWDKQWQKKFLQKDKQV